MSRRGFTLLELMLVVAISGTVAAAGGMFYLEARVGAARIESQVELQRIASLIAESVARDLRGAASAENSASGIVVRSARVIRYEVDGAQLSRVVEGEAEPWVLTKYGAAIAVAPWERGPGWVVRVRVGREFLEGRRVAFDREVLVRRTAR